MADRRDYYFREIVSEAELDVGFDTLESADRDQAIDWDQAAVTLSSLYGGILSGLVVTNGGGFIANVSIGVAYDESGRRVRTEGALSVDISQSGNTAIGAGGVPTGGVPIVPVIPDTVIVSLFLVFDRALFDPRVDGAGATVQFVRDESFHFNVVAGIAATPAVNLPPLGANRLLLADITISDAAITVIDTDRRQVWLRAVDDAIPAVPTARVGAGFPIRGLILGTELATAQPHGARLAIQQLLGYYNDHTRNDASVADRHHAIRVIYDSVPNWATGAAPGGIAGASDVETVVDAIVTDLASVAVGADGAETIGAEAIAGAPNSLAVGSARSQINELLVDINDHLNDAAGAHAATAISAAPTANWNGGEAVTAYTTVQGGLDTIVSDLASEALGASGSLRIGVSATAGVGLGFDLGVVDVDAGSLASALTDIINGVNARVRKGGDTISGDLLPNAAGTVNVGTAAVPFLGVATRRLTAALGVDDAVQTPLGTFRARNEATDAIIISAVGGLQHRQNYFADDFVAFALDTTNMYEVAVGGTSTVTILTAGADARGGVVALHGVAADALLVSLNTAKVYNLNTVITHMYARAKLELADNNQVVKIGFRNGRGAGETAYAYFKNDVATGSWIGVVRRAGAETVTPAIMAIDTSYHDFEIRMRTGSSKIDFVIDDTNIQLWTGAGVVDNTLYEMSVEMSALIGNHDVFLDRWEMSTAAL